MTQESKRPDEKGRPVTLTDRHTSEVVQSSELLKGGQELLIQHEGRLYRLRRTRLGKLILTA